VAASDLSPHVPLLAAVLLALNLQPAVAADLVFSDGKTWLEVKIVSQESTSLVVLHDGAVETVHAAQLTPECMAALNLRPPTAEELAARAAAEERAREEVARRQEQLKQFETVQAVYAVYAARAELETRERERVAAEMRTSQPRAAQVVRETSGVVPAGEYRYTDSNGVVHVLAAYRLY